jgi:hypothetical protein
VPSDAGFVYNELSGPYTREYTSRPCMLWAKNSDLSSYPGRSNWSQSISHHGTPHNQLRAREFGVIRVIDAGYLSDVIARLLQCIAGLRVTRQRCRTKDATELRDRITQKVDLVVFCPPNSEGFPRCFWGGGTPNKRGKESRFAARAPFVLPSTSYLVDHGHLYIEGLSPIARTVRWTVLFASISSPPPTPFPF